MDQIKIEKENEKWCTDCYFFIRFVIKTPMHLTFMIKEEGHDISLKMNTDFKDYIWKNETISYYYTFYEPKEFTIVV